eukprot:SAG31_NODE_1946_length_6844_cov_5.947665_5_plen_166_part_00
MRAILWQDREYFDFHHAGVLQERLNHDTGMLAHHVIRQPADFVAMISHVVSKTIYMYTLNRRLFFVSISVPIPLTLLLCWASIEYLRSLHRKIRRVHEVAAAGSIDVLREITTVRQFGMEEKVRLAGCSFAVKAPCSARCAVPYVGASCVGAREVFNNESVPSYP